MVIKNPKNSTNNFFNYLNFILFSSDNKIVKTETNKKISSERREDLPARTSSTRDDEAKIQGNTSRYIARNRKAVPPKKLEPLSEDYQVTITIPQESRKDIVIGLIINPETKSETTRKIRTEPPGEVVQKAQSSPSENFGDPSKSVVHKTTEYNPQEQRGSIYVFPNFQVIGRPTL